MPDYWKILNRVEKGDEVSVVASSASLASVYPQIFNLGIRRLETELGLKPRIMPHALNPHITMRQRREDLERSFRDPDIKAVIAMIGGSEQIRLIKELDPKAFSASPKPFFGYSDNTHFCNYLWKLGIPSFYGGCIMTQYAMQKDMYPETVESLRWAFSDRTRFELKNSAVFTDTDLALEDPENLGKQRFEEVCPPHVFDGSGLVSGRLWGGCLESLDYMLKVPGRAPDLRDPRTLFYFWKRLRKCLVRKPFRDL